MALLKTGYVACPDCGQPAIVGIANEGDGNAVHVICKPCMYQLQASRWQGLGPRIIERTSRHPGGIVAQPSIFDG